MLRLPKSKGTVFPVHSMKAYKGSRGIAPLIFNLCARWQRVVNFSAWLLYPWERTPQVCKFLCLCSLVCKDENIQSENYCITDFYFWNTRQQKNFSDDVTHHQKSNVIKLVFRKYFPACQADTLKTQLKFRSLLWHINLRVCFLPCFIMVVLNILRYWPTPCNVSVFVVIKLN